MTTHNLR